MVPSLEYAVIRAQPNEARGEAVNIGVVVLRQGMLDVRLPELRKLVSLTGHSWEEYGSIFTDVVRRSSVSTLSELTESLQHGVFSLSAIGRLADGADDQVSKSVQTVLDFYVSKPKLSRGGRRAKVNSEISAMLKRVGALASRSDGLEDGKVISNFVVSEDKELVADFAYRGSVLKVVSTLELRTAASAAHARACERGAILHFAKKELEGNVKPIAVYALQPERSEMFTSEVEILREFSSGNCFNWLNASDRQKFQHMLY